MVADTVLGTGLKGFENHFELIPIIFKLRRLH